MNFVRFNKARYKELLFGRGNSSYMYRMGEELTESSLAEKDLGGLVDEKLDKS